MEQRGRRNRSQTSFCEALAVKIRDDIADALELPSDKGYSSRRRAAGSRSRRPLRPYSQTTTDARSRSRGVRPAKSRGFRPIGMEQVWNRGCATGRKRRLAETAGKGLKQRQTLPPAAIGCRLDRMVNRASATGCQPLREVPSLRGRESTRRRSRLVEGGTNRSESLLHD
jgi:hypothetical protein